MRKWVLAVVLALAVTVPAGALMAASKSPKLARCDGKQRRAANPYGSILPTVDPQTGAPTPANQPQNRSPGSSGVEVFPNKDPAPAKPAEGGAKAPPQVPPISAAEPPQSYRSC